MLSLGRQLDQLTGIAQIAPLIACVIAPFSTLMDIPAFSQPWFAKDGKHVHDFHASFILSVIGLVFNVIANALLMARFSSSERWWRTATQSSLICWITKAIIGITNLAYFGAKYKVKLELTFEEAYWCGVVSASVSVIVAGLLLTHRILAFDKEHEHHRRRGTKFASGSDVRFYGRHFMLHVTFFFSVLGLSALVFSHIESWEYFDGVYFTTVSALTVGFGDLQPTTAVGKVILFPVVVILIAQLANIIGMIARFFKDRTEELQDDWQRNFELLHQAEEDFRNPVPGLDQELRLLQDILRKVEMRRQSSEIRSSTITFLVFWFVGAAIFDRIEGWSYGNSLYFCYVFFLTMGFGDFSPVTPGGRVFFVTYSLMAVPVMTSFAIQVITSTVEYLSNRSLHHREKKHGAKTDIAPKDGDKPFLSHSELVAEAHIRLDRITKPRDLRDAAQVSSVAIMTVSGQSEDSEKTATEESAIELAEHVLHLATRLEGHARKLLVGHLSKSTSAEIINAGILLKADWNVQRREVKALLDCEPDPEYEISGDRLGIYHDRGKFDLQTGITKEKDTLDEVVLYRECFAELLAAGGRLKKLEGSKKLLFERRRAAQTASVASSGY